jgi:MFS family permease
VVTDLSADARRILGAQALRAFAYGLGAVLLGTTLEARGFSSLEAGAVLTAVVGGTVVASLAVGRFGDRVGRRRSYLALHLLLAGSGAVFAFAQRPEVLVLVALLGALSTEVVESGPFTSLEQAMLASELTGRSRVRGFGIYNAVATAGGALGALAAGAPGLARHLWDGAPADQRWFLLFAPVALTGAVIAATLSPGVEPDPPAGPAGRPPLEQSRPVVYRLAALFSLDSFGGGFVVQSFIAYWFAVRFGASPATLGAVFAGVGLLQTGSFLVAPRLAERFGLLPTMVFTHLPSNVLLALIAAAPNLGVAVALLLARVALSQMDVPTRQAYVMALVPPGERTAASAVTNAARYVTRPAGPALAGAVQSLALGAPFVLAGVVKGAYDLILWRWFRSVPVPQEPPAGSRREP